MRILAVLAVLATLAWGGYWFAGSRGLDHAITTGLARTPDVQVAGHSIRGFPNRFDVTFDQPRVQANGVEWSAPFVQFFALSYRLNHLLAVFAHDQRIQMPGLDLSVRSNDLRASLVMEPGLDLPMERFTLVGEGLELVAAGQTHIVDGLRAASRRISEREHELVLLMEDVFPELEVIEALDPEGHWPRVFQVLRLDGVVTVDRPLDRHLIGGPEPRLESMALTGGRMAWIGVDIVASGRLEPGPDGLLSGDIQLTVTGHRSLMETARGAGLIPPESLTLLTIAMQGLADPEDPDTIHAALSVTNGTLRFGPLVLGQIPAIF